MCSVLRESLAGMTEQKHKYLILSKNMMNYLKDFILEFYTSILVNGAENDRLVFQKYR